MKRSDIEIMAPVGSYESLAAAIRAGADAVYFGVGKLNMRSASAANFTLDDLGRIVASARKAGVKTYLTVNTIVYEDEIADVHAVIDRAKKEGVDAVIASDMAAILYARRIGQEVHISTQSNISNSEAVRFYAQWADTVVLARELSLEQVAAIRRRIVEDDIRGPRGELVEIEMFAHGALCMAYSGRCLLSGYINKRDPNQGTCTNACRWEYNVQEGKEDDVGNIVHKYEPIPVQNVEPTLGIGAPTDKVFMIEEAQRPGEYMTAFEDEHGTYIMNSKDLRAIAHVERLTKMGVHSLKIEGRTKSFYYCARTAQVYRKAIDDAAAGKPFDTSLLETLEGLAHRGYTEGFLRRHTHDDYQNYEYGYSVSDRQQFVGEFTGERKGELAAVAVKNKFSVGDSLELMTPQGNINFTLEHMENAKGEAMPVAPGDGYTVWLPVPQDLELNYALLMRNFSGETTRNPHGK